MKYRTYEYKKANGEIKESNFASALISDYWQTCDRANTVRFKFPSDSAFCGLQVWIAKKLWDGVKFFAPKSFTFKAEKGHFDKAAGKWVIDESREITAEELADAFSTRLGQGAFAM